MIRYKFFILIISLSAFWSCTSKQDSSQTKTAPIDTATLIQEGRTIVQSTFTTLSSNLSGALKEGGVAHTLQFCNVEAMPLTDSLSSHYGIEIRRASHRPRNPQNQADSLELASIRGNTNDEDAESYESHYSEITRNDQVQIYEAILGDPDGEVTTGLLTAIRYIKDNRILPKGFDKENAHEDIAVKGTAIDDENFTGRSDRVRYRIKLNQTEREGPVNISAELYYQPIAFRWAKNLADYDAPETNRFTGYYDSMSGNSSVVLENTTLRLK